MAKIVVDSSSLTQPLLLYPGLGPVMPFPLFLFGFFIALRFPLPFHPCFVSVFSPHVGFISNLPQLYWD
jgi:hypothetical protein